MHVTPDQIRAARALLRLEQAESAARAKLMVVTIRRREQEMDKFLRIIATAARCLLSSVSLLETSMVLAAAIQRH